MRELVDRQAWGRASRVNVRTGQHKFLDRPLSTDRDIYYGQGHFYAEMFRERFDSTMYSEVYVEDKKKLTRWKKYVDKIRFYMQILCPIDSKPKSRLKLIC